MESIIQKITVYYAKILSQRPRRPKRSSPAKVVEKRFAGEKGSASVPQEKTLLDTEPPHVVSTEPESRFRFRQLMIPTTWKEPMIKPGGTPIRVRDEDDGLNMTFCLFEIHQTEARVIHAHLMSVDKV